MVKMVLVWTGSYGVFSKIEESFKIMKSDLDARPVYLQKEETITGHFLICYLTVLIERIFQFKILGDKYSTTEIFKFIKDFKVTKAETKYINTTTYSGFINDLSEMTGLPLTNYFLKVKFHPVRRCKEAVKPVALVFAFKSA